MTVQRIGFNGNRLRALSYFLCFWCQTCVFLISKMKKRVQETWQALGGSWIQDWKRCTKCSLRMLNFLPSFGALATDCKTCQTDQLVGKGIGKWNKLKTVISTWLANVKMYALFSQVKVHLTQNIFSASTMRKMRFCGSRRKLYGWSISVETKIRSIKYEVAIKVEVTVRGILQVWSYLRSSAKPLALVAMTNPYDLYFIM